MPQCLLCLEDKPSLTDEHIIYAALGSNLVLPKSTCKECQAMCNSTFEQRFLKGSNFVALLRAYLGIKGRRNEPIYGFDRHGNPLTMTVQQGFPPIKVGIGANQLVRPMQVIMCVAERVQDPISYHFCPELIERPITTDFFEGVVDEIPSAANCAALWADGDLVPVNYWRELFETFVSWSNSKDLAAMSSIASTQNSGLELAVEWNADSTLRGLAKIGFMYAMSKTRPENRLSDDFRNARQYIRRGVGYPGAQRRSPPVFQWNGLHPGLEAFGDRNFTYLLATANTAKGLFGFVQLHSLGLYAVKLAEPENGPVCPDTITLYHRNKTADDRHVLDEEPLSSEVATAFAQSAEANGQV